MLERVFAKGDLIFCQKSSDGYNSRQKYRSALEGIIPHLTNCAGYKWASREITCIIKYSEGFFKSSTATSSRPILNNDFPDKNFDQFFFSLLLFTLIVILDIIKIRPRGGGVISAKRWQICCSILSLTGRVWNFSRVTNESWTKDFQKLQKLLKYPFVKMSYRWSSVYDVLDLQHFMVTHLYLW